VRINIAIPEEHVKKPVLDGALEAVTRLNESLLEAGATPTDEQLIAKGAIWKPEPPGQEHFDHGGIIAERGHGDCDDWAPLRAARLRVTGEDPGAKAVVRKSGAKRWHATVIRSDGSEDDPSLDAGMPGPRVSGHRGAWLPQMQASVHGVNGAFINTPQLALRPVADRHGQIESWQARADLPWHWHPGNSPSDVAMVTLHRSPVSSQAIVGAVLGARALGIASEMVDPEHLKRMSAIADACEGATWEDIEGEYGAEHANAASTIVGSFFGKALRKIGKVAKGAVRLAAPALSLVPGGSLATAAFNAASPTLRKAVMKQSHVPAAQRQPVRVSPVQPNATQSRFGAPSPGAGMPQFLPYPYPLPYPVPGWTGGAEPGVAWPPRST
jgi:hypothetical protein